MDHREAGAGSGGRDEDDGVGDALGGCGRLGCRALDALPHLYSYEGEGRVWVRRRAVPLTPEQSARLTAFALATDGKRFALGPDPTQAGATVRARIDVATGRVSIEPYDDRISEFPRIDDRLATRSHRYFTVSGKTAGMANGVWNVLRRVDTQTGSIAEWDSGRKVFSEVVFAAAEGGAPEQGYYTTFRTDLDTLTSDWVVLDAGDITAGPIAAFRNSRKKAFWLGPESDQTVCADVVSAPTAWDDVEQEPLNGAAAVGVAPTGVVASRPLSPPVEPAHSP